MSGGGGGPFPRFYLEKSRTAPQPGRRGTAPADKGKGKKESPLTFSKGAEQTAPEEGKTGKWRERELTKIVQEEFCEGGKKEFRPV